MERKKPEILILNEHFSTFNPFLNFFNDPFFNISPFNIENKTEKKLVIKFNGELNEETIDNIIEELKTFKNEFIEKNKIQMLEKELNEAVSREDYRKAAEIKEKIDSLKSSKST
jgi:excinuclease UvrABC helicase subunit UvrB